MDVDAGRLMAGSDYETKFNTIRNVIREAGTIQKRELLAKGSQHQCPRAGRGHQTPD